MRFAVLAFALLTLAAAPAWAQQTDMDRAERELRDAMAPAASAGATVERVAPNEIRVRMPSDITFDFNRAEVRYEFMPRIHDLARTLTRHPNVRVNIIGHADAIGSDAYNQELSERRARSVGAALINNGVQWQRIEAVGRGEWEPIASNASDWGRAQNRRVEIRVSAMK
jgi:outer membrane protein OmpA-like peptidoglycan-associated protein